MSTVADRTVVRLKDFRAADVGRRVSNVVSSLADQLVGRAKTTDGFVRSRPWQMAGAIALAGVAAGMLVSRRARRRAEKNANLESTSEVSGG
jgi:ElaB/YqjD/DUF883 family membrane-anchored ribosome-binding protein